MAHPTIDPALGPVLARTGDERAILDAFLDFHRANVLRKARGLTDADAARRLVPSLTTLAGLLKHLTLVEGNWFRCLFAPEPGDVYVTSQADADASFTLRPGETVEALAAA
ncbi:mycothiol transferase, partial [Micromonospora sp. CPCC 205714]